MKDLAVVYATKCGHTKQYADWIKEEMNADIFVHTSFTATKALEYKAIVFAGAVYNDKIMIMDWLKKNLGQVNVNKFVIAAVSWYSNDSKEAKDFLISQNYPEQFKNVVPLIVLNSGIDKKKISVVDKAQLMAAQSAINKHDMRTADDINALAIIKGYSESTSKDNLKPLYEAVKNIIDPQKKPVAKSAPAPAPKPAPTPAAQPAPEPKPAPSVQAASAPAAAAKPAPAPAAQTAPKPAAEPKPATPSQAAPAPAPIPKSEPSPTSAQTTPKPSPGSHDVTSLEDALAALSSGNILANRPAGHTQKSESAPPTAHEPSPAPMPNPTPAPAPVPVKKTTPAPVSAAQTAPKPAATPEPTPDSGVKDVANIVIKTIREKVEDEKNGKETAYVGADDIGVPSINHIMDNITPDSAISTNELGYAFSLSDGGSSSVHSTFAHIKDPNIPPLNDVPESVKNDPTLKAANDISAAGTQTAPKPEPVSSPKPALNPASAKEVPKSAPAPIQTAPEPKHEPAKPKPAPESAPKSASSGSRNSYMDMFSRKKPAETKPAGNFDFDPNDIETAYSNSPAPSAVQTAPVSQPASAPAPASVDMDFDFDLLGTGSSTASTTSTRALNAVEDLAKAKAKAEAEMMKNELERAKLEAQKAAEKINNTYDVIGNSIDQNIPENAEYSGGYSEDNDNYGSDNSGVSAPDYDDYGDDVILVDNNDDYEIETLTAEDLLAPEEPSEHKRLDFKQLQEEIEASIEQNRRNREKDLMRNMRESERKAYEEAEKEPKRGIKQPEDADIFFNRPGKDYYSSDSMPEIKFNRHKR